jgi:hypothetical protein
MRIVPNPEQPQPLDMSQVARLNGDLLQRLVEEGLTITYDEDGDTLFLTIGRGVPALTEFVTYGIHVRIEPESLRIVGVDILQFRKRFLANNELIRVTCGADFDAMCARGGIAVVEGETAKRFLPLFDAVIPR